VKRKDQPPPVSYLGQLKVPAGKLHALHISGIIVAHPHIGLLEITGHGTLLPGRTSCISYPRSYEVNHEEDPLPDQGSKKDA